MNTKSTRNAIILIGLAFLAVVAFGIFGKTKANAQQIIDYLDNMAPVAQAHAQWIEDYQILTELYAVLSNSEKMEELNKLLDRMEAIQIDIEQSKPPDILSGVKAKWNSECVKILQVVYQISLTLEIGKPEWITEAYEFLLEADRLRQEWKGGLSSLLDEYNIESTDFAYDSYF